MCQTGMESSWCEKNIVFWSHSRPCFLFWLKAERSDPRFCLQVNKLSRKGSKRDTLEDASFFSQICTQSPFSPKARSPSKLKINCSKTDAFSKEKQDFAHCSEAANALSNPGKSFTTRCFTARTDFLTRCQKVDRANRYTSYG